MTLKRRLAGLAVLVGMIGALLATTTSALGEHEPTNSSLPDIGVLRLHMDSDGDYLLYQPHQGGNTYGDPGSSQQDIELSKKCLVDLNPSATAVTLTGSTSSVGYNNHEVGLWDGGSKGVPCGLAESDEGAIVLELAGSLADREIDYFEVDIEGKHNVIVLAEMYFGPDMVDSTTLDACEESDCGSDSADGDNFRWTYIATQPFNRIEFSVDASSPNNGAFSLAGGHDGTDVGDLGALLDGGLGTSDSLFHITDIEGLICDDPSGATQFEGNLYSVSLQQCNKPPVFVIFSSGAGFVLLETLGNPGGFGLYLEEINFPAAAADPSAGQLPFILTHDDVVPLDGGDAVETPQCLYSPDPDGDGVLSPSAELAMPATHTTCYFEATFTQQASGDWTASYRLLNIGDGWRGTL